MEEFGGKVYWPDLTTWLRTIRQCKFLDHVDKPFGSSAAIREIRNGKVCGKKSKIRNFATFCYFLPLSTTFRNLPFNRDHWKVSLESFVAILIETDTRATAACGLCHKGFVKLSIVWKPYGLFQNQRVPCVSTTELGGNRSVIEIWQILLKGIIKYALDFEHSNLLFSGFFCF